MALLHGRLPQKIGFARNGNHHLFPFRPSISCRSNRNSAFISSSSRLNESASVETEGPLAGTSLLMTIEEEVFPFSCRDDRAGADCSIIGFPGTTVSPVAVGRHLPLSLRARALRALIQALGLKMYPMLLHRSVSSARSRCSSCTQSSGSLLPNAAEAARSI